MLESTEAFNKFANGKSWRQLDFQTQQQIRLAAILEQAYARYGDTLADTTQSRHNQFIASLKNVQLALGQAFLPIYNAILPPLTELMNKLSQAISVIKIFTEAIFGKPNSAKQQADAVKQQADAISALNKSVNNTSKNLDKASKSAKKAKKEIGGLIGGLDEINNLSVSTTAGTSSSDSNTNTSTAGGLGNLDTIDIGDTIDTSGLDKKAEKIKAIFDKIKKIISDNKETIIAIMAGLMTGLGVILIANWGKVASSFARHFPKLSKLFSGLSKVIFKPFSLLKKGIGILLGLNPVVAAVAIAIGIFVGALVYLWRNNEDFRKKVIKTWKALKDALKPWVEGFKILFEVLADVVGTVLIGAFKLAGKVILKVVEVFTGDVMNGLEDLAPVIKELGEKFKKLAKNFEKGWKKIKNFSLKKWLDDKKKEFNKGIKRIKDDFADIGKEIQKDWDKTVDAAKEFVINIGAKVEDFKEKVSEKWDEVKDWFKDKFVEIGTKFSETKENLKKKWEDLTSNIKNKTADMKAKIASKWSDLKSKWSDITNNIKTKTADMKAKVATKWSDLKTKWSNLTSNFKDKTMDFKVKLSTAVGNIKNFVNDIIKQVNKKLIAKLSFSLKAPSWLGGGTWGWKAPEIPYLAKGGIIDSPTLAMVGEAGKEAVMPLENNTGWITDLAGKITSRMGDTGYSNSTNNQPREVYNGDFVLNLDGNTVLRQPIVSILRQLKRQGITI